MKKIIYFLIFFIFLLSISLAYAIVPDADTDLVPDENDICPNSPSLSVDQYGCSCSQKTNANCIQDITNFCQQIPKIGDCDISYIAQIICCDEGQTCDENEEGRAQCTFTNITTAVCPEITNPNEIFVYRMYKILLNRSPDCEGFDYNVRLLNFKNQSDVQLFDGFIGSSEYKEKYGDGGQPIEDYVTNLYRVVLDREHDLGGYENFVNALNAGTVTSWKVYQDFITSEEYRNKPELRTEAAVQCAPGVCLYSTSLYIGNKTGFNKTTGPCDPITHPSPDWGERKGVCLPSCGFLGGKACCEQGCDENGFAGTSYDCNHCCRNSCRTKTTWNLNMESGDFLCKEAIPNHNNLEENRINVVFVGVNYDTTYRFREDVINSIDYDGNNFGILSVEPFKSNKNKFNFFYVDGIGNVEGYREGFTEWGFESDNIINKLSQRCVMNNKEIIALINWVFRSNAGRDLAYVSLSKDENFIRTLVHEIGHSIGELRDEYVSYFGQVAPHSIDNEQCYLSSFVECPSSPYTGISCFPTEDAINDCNNNAKWKNLIGRGCGKDNVVDCFRTEIKCEDITYEDCPKGICLKKESKLCPKEDCIKRTTHYCYIDLPSRPEGNLEVSCSFFGGCYYLNPFRPNFNTIMRAQVIDPFSFGPVNERLICNVIKETTGSAGGICNEY